MTNPQRNYLIAGIIAIVVIAFGAYLVLHKGATGAPTNATSTSSASSTDMTATSSAGAITGSGDAAYTINLVSDNAIPPAPSFTKPLVFDAAANPNVRAALNAQFVTIQGRLAKDPKDFNALVDLAMIHHLGGDNTGAVELWVYASALYPGNKVTFNNLGNYYVDQKNYAKAESEYLQAQKNDQANLDVYKSLFQMYSTAYKTTGTAAEDILKKGIANNPKAFDLRVLLARYYKSKGRTADAQAQYQAAISVATAQGNAAAAAQLQAESNQ